MLWYAPYTPLSVSGEMPTTEPMLMIVPVLPLNEGRSGGVGQASEGGDVESDHLFHLLGCRPQAAGATEAKPALLTSMVMLGSSFSFVSTFARSVSLLRSATMEVMCRPLALERLAASALSGSSLRADENEVVSPFCETVCIDSSDAPGGSGDEGCAL